MSLFIAFILLQHRLESDTLYKQYIKLYILNRLTGHQNSSYLVNNLLVSHVTFVYKP